MSNQNLTHIIEQMIERLIGKPVKYDPTTGEFLVIGDDEKLAVYVLQCDSEKEKGQ